MATKTAFVRARIEPAVKERAERVLDRLGLSPSTVIGVLYRQIAIRDALPFATPPRTLSLLL